MLLTVLIGLFTLLCTVMFFRLCICNACMYLVSAFILTLDSYIICQHFVRRDKYSRMINRQLACLCQKSAFYEDVRLWPWPLNPWRWKYYQCYYRAAWNADAVLRWDFCLSVCQTRASWQNGRKICPDFYTMRKIILSSFIRRRMVGGGRPLLSEILGQPARIGAKSPILNQ